MLTGDDTPLATPRSVDHTNVIDDTSIASTTPAVVPMYATPLSTTATVELAIDPLPDGSVNTDSTAPVVASSATTVDPVVTITLPPAATAPPRTVASGYDHTRAPVDGLRASTPDPASTLTMLVEAEAGHVEADAALALDSRCR
jgi:hypothetical protein